MQNKSTTKPEQNNKERKTSIFKMENAIYQKDYIYKQKKDETKQHEK